MSYKINPLHKLLTEIEAPPSITQTIKSIFLCALEPGVVSNPMMNEETLYAIRSLRKMGVKFRKKGELSSFESSLKPTSVFIGHCKLSLEYLSMLSTLVEFGYVTIKGNIVRHDMLESMLNSIRDIGIETIKLNPNGVLPLKVHSGFNGGEISIIGEGGHKAMSSILMMAPYAKNPVKINVIGKVSAAPYVNETIGLMSKKGINVDESFKIGPQKYNAGWIRIGVDKTYCSYFLCAAAMNGELKITNLDEHLFIHDVLMEMGCSTQNPLVTPKKLKGISIDLYDYPDLVPAVALTCAFAHETSVISNVAFLGSELEELEYEMNKMDIEVKRTSDGLIIKGGNPKPSVVESKNPLIVMAFALAGLKIGMEIQNPMSVTRLYPEFWRVFRRL